MPGKATRDTQLSAIFAASLRLLAHDCVAEGGPRLFRPVAEVEIGEERKRKPGVRVDPEERPARAPVPVGARRGERAGEVRLLPVLELEGEAPVVRVVAAEARDHTGE